MPGPSRLRRFSIWHAALLLPWVIAAYGFGRSFNDNSYLWHVRAGDWQTQNGHVLNFDPFSFTMEGEPWRTQSWLAELLYSRLDALAGLSAAPFITTACASLLFILLGLVAYRRSKSIISVVVFLVATAIAVAGFLNPRPVIFSFPLFAAVVVADGDRRMRWALPLIMWVWAAVHGSFFIGLAFLGLRALGRGLTWRRLVELLLAGAPTLLTAHGVGVVGILLAFLTNRDAINMMSEWRTPDLLSLPFMPVFLGFFAMAWLARQGKIGRSDWLLLLPFFALAVSANRSVPPAWIALSPILSRLTIPVPITARSGGPIPVVLALLLVALPFIPSSDEAVSEERFPVEAAAHLSTERPFHDDATGGWLIYTQWPERLVYIDDRAELFGDQMRRFIEARGGRDVWREEFSRWSMEEALLQVDAPLAETLRSTGWEEVYEDENFVVLRESQAG